jgi:hypothetical protein
MFLIPTGDGTENFQTYFKRVRLPRLVGPYRYVDSQLMGAAQIMLGWSLVAMVWCVLKMQMEETAS